MTCARFHASVIPMTSRHAGRTVLFFALLCSAAIVCSLITPATSAAAPDAVKPTIVLVHGAWADASSWNGEVDELQAQGYVVRAIANPLENLTTDSADVADFLRSIDGPIVLVGHSYGGSVITNAAAGNPNVKALVYVDAAAPDVGETNGSLSGADSVLKHIPEDELFDKLPYPGAPAGAVDLYLKKDVFLRTSAMTFPPTWRPGCGRRNGPPRPPRSTPRRATRRGRRSRRGTSSAAATRSSRRHRNAPWRRAPIPPSPSSTAARTSP